MRFLPLAKCEPWLLIKDYRAASFNLCRRSGPGSAASLLFSLECECVEAHSTVVVFLNLFLCSLLISVWMFSRSLSGIQWRLPCRVPWSPAVRLSERPAEECRLKCDVWEEKVLLVFTFCHLPVIFQSFFLSPLSLSLHTSLCQAVSSWLNLIILTVSKDDPS